MSAPPGPDYRKTLPPVLGRKEVARLFGVVPRTLQNPAWDRRLQPFRTAGGHRRYRREAVAEVLGWWFR